MNIKCPKCGKIIYDVKNDKDNITCPACHKEFNMKDEYKKVNKSALKKSLIVAGCVAAVIVVVFIVSFFTRPKTTDPVTPTQEIQTNLTKEEVYNNFVNQVLTKGLVSETDTTIYYLDFVSGLIPQFGQASTCFVAKFSEDPTEENYKTTIESLSLYTLANDNTTYNILYLTKDGLGDSYFSTQNTTAKKAYYSISIVENKRIDTVKNTCFEAYGYDTFTSEDLDYWSKIVLKYLIEKLNAYAESYLNLDFYTCYGVDISNCEVYSIARSVDSSNTPPTIDKSKIEVLDYKSFIYSSVYSLDTTMLDFDAINTAYKAKEGAQESENSTYTSIQLGDATLNTYKDFTVFQGFKDIKYEEKNIVEYASAQMKYIKNENSSFNITIMDNSATAKNIFETIVSTNKISAYGVNESLYLYVDIVTYNEENEVSAYTRFYLVDDVIVEMNSTSYDEIVSLDSDLRALASK